MTENEIRLADTISVPRAAKVLDLTYQQTLRLGQAGSIELWRDDDGHWRITRVSLDRYVKAQRRRVATA